MTKTMISVENLSKVYRLGTIGSGSLRDDLQIWWSNIRGKENPLLKIGSSSQRIDGKYLWALRDINLEVKQGEILGVIGKNGAGKSTLLKILSRITAPTGGQYHLGGRLSSLIEVGTGFHSELTGRENIYLNGAIHGMSRTEIDRQLDEIIEFSGVESYIDTPVKRYSSGMYVRLGFAVAAHLNSDILLVDEVLAVGDAEFQNKAIGKIGDAAEQGRTILFVSHNIVSVKKLCSRVILIGDGQVVADGYPKEVVQKYFDMQRNEQLEAVVTEVCYPENREISMHLNAVRMLNEADEIFPCLSAIETSQSLRVEIEYTVNKPKSSAYVMCTFQNQEGAYVLWTYDGDSPAFGNREKGKYKASFSVPSGLFTKGRYDVLCAIVDVTDQFTHFPGRAFSFLVEDTDSFLAYRNISWPGVIRTNPEWETVKIR